MRKSKNERSRAISSIKKNVEQVDNDNVLKSVLHIIGYYLLGEHGDNMDRNVKNIAYVTECMILYETSISLERLAKFAELLLNIEISENERGV